MDDEERARKRPLRLDRTERLERAAEDARKLAAPVERDARRQAWARSMKRAA
jgi:hypothetical protein